MTIEIKANSEAVLVETKDELTKAIEMAHARISQVAEKYKQNSGKTLLETFTAADFAALDGSKEIALVADLDGLDSDDCVADDGVAHAA